MNFQRILTISLRTTLVLLVVLAAAVILFNRTLRSPRTIDLPDQAAGLALHRTLSGQEAAAEVNRVHGEEFALTSAQVGYYGQAEALVIRVSGTLFVGATQLMASSITEKLDGSTGGLTPISERRERGRSIYMLSGEDDDTHLYFQSERTLVWISGPTDLAETSLVELLDFYP